MLKSHSVRDEEFKGGYYLKLYNHGQMVILDVSSL